MGQAYESLCLEGGQLGRSDLGSNLNPEADAWATSWERVVHVPALYRGWAHAEDPQGQC